MGFLYQIFIHFLSFSIHVASLFNRKAKLWIKGRKHLFLTIKSHLSGQKNVVWFHCASLGEFEQARPLIEKFKAPGSDFEVIITFFSSSGYEVRKNYEGADFIFYFPLDTLSNAKKFLDIVKPSKVFFVKYDLWYNCLNELYKRKIPTYLVSANFRKNQFRGLYGKYLKKVLSFFTQIFVQNEAALKLLNEYRFTNVMLGGDLRYDRVAQTASNPKKIQLIHYFKGNSRIVVAGSTWKKDEDIVSGFNPDASWDQVSPKGLFWTNVKLIIAPHEINEDHIQSIIQRFNNSVILRYSEISKEPVSSALDKLQEGKVLIIDNIGMLSNLYQYADIAYIGGGFGDGIHNILEAVAFGVPVIFGPNHHKFPEAEELINAGGAFEISDSESLKKSVELLFSDVMIHKMASMVCRNFIEKRKGAVEKVISQVKIN